LCEKALAANLPVYAVTAAFGSPLDKMATESIVLTCGAEKAVAASKTVIEQALLAQAVLGGDEWKNLGKAADACAAVLAQDPHVQEIYLGLAAPEG